MDAQLKVSRAIIKLVANHTFYGSCALKVKVVECKKTKTMSTDGRNIFWGREAVDRWTEEEVIGVVAHEIMHIIMLHHLRCGERTHVKWNIAGDFGINIILRNQGFELPEGVLLDPKYKDWNAEKIYDDLGDEYHEEPTWGFVTEMKDDQGNPLVGDERQKAIDGVNEMIAQAAQEAKKAGQTLHGSIEDIVQTIRRPQIDWITWLRTNIIAKGNTDSSWNRPNRKMLSELDMYMPSMVDNRCGPLAFILDTSCSVSSQEREVFLAELQSINESMKPEIMHIICVDTDVAKCESFTPDDNITELAMKGGGGTDMTPGFNYVRDCLPEVDSILCFSDCEFGDWPEEPEKPVIWLSTGQTDNPYGTLIPVNF